jgi:hypothetical protein
MREVITIPPEKGEEKPVLAANRRAKTPSQRADGGNVGDKRGKVKATF